MISHLESLFSYDFVKNITPFSMFFDLANCLSWKKKVLSFEKRYNILGFRSEKAEDLLGNHK